MDFDPRRSRGLRAFCCPLRRDKRALPFLVTAGLRPDAPAGDGLTETARSGSDAPSGSSVAGTGRELFLGNAAAENEARSEFDGVAPATAGPMVEPKKPASLHVFSGSMQMHLGASKCCLWNRGALHRSVLVRVAGGSKIQQGEVVAPGQLQSRF